MSIQNRRGQKKILGDATYDFKNSGACVIISGELSSIMEIVKQNFEEASTHTNFTFFYE